MKSKKTTSGVFTKREARRIGELLETWRGWGRGYVTVEITSYESFDQWKSDGDKSPHASLYRITKSGKLKRVDTGE